MSPDQASALVEVEYVGDPEDAADKTDAVIAAVADVQDANPDFYVGSFGESTDQALQASFADDLKKAGLFSVPLTLIILLIAFGALVAAGIPLLLGLSAVLGTFGLMSIVSNVVPMDDSVGALVLLVGLAVGVDYSMFYLKREREERAAGRTEGAALEAAAATSGHSVLVSGITVIVAMGGMLLTGDATFASFGVATMIVVGVAMLGSLTVLPARPRQARRPGRPRPGSRSPGASAVRTVRAGSGEPSSTGCSAAPSSRSCWRADCCWPSRPRRCR